MEDLDLVKIGRWALLLGIILSVLPVFVSIKSLSIILYILGLIVGFLHITDKESTSFLVALIALIIIGVATVQLGGLTYIMASILNNFIGFLSAAGLIVALKQIFGIVKE